MSNANAIAAGISIRTVLQPGDLGGVVRLHGMVYAAECGFDPTFEAYVAIPLAQFVRARSDRERLWLAERGGSLVGCVAIVQAGPGIAQLRWYLIAPEARRIGLGKRLLAEAVSFARSQGYGAIILWTISSLEVAGRLYVAAGFRVAEERPVQLWGVEVVEQRYEMTLR